MTLTPVAGTYAVWFTGSVAHSVFGSSIFTSIYSGGVQFAASQRVATLGDNDENSFACVAEVVVNGAQAIEGRWRTSIPTATMHQRVLYILRVA